MTVVVKIILFNHAYFGSFAEKYFVSLVPVLAPVFNIVNRFYHVNVILVHFYDASSILRPNCYPPLKRKTNIW